MMESLNYSAWERLDSDIVNHANQLFPGTKVVDEAWRWDYQTSTFLIQSSSWGMHCFGSTIHLSVKKVDIRQLLQNSVKAFNDSQEPTYAEKVHIAEKLITHSDPIAMEVFPDEKNLVDHANLYHIWGVQKSLFPFWIDQVAILPENKEWKETNIFGLNIDFIVHSFKQPKGKLTYLYLKRKDGKELCWREKQKLKNALLPESINAIEIIVRSNICSHSCLLCLPIGFSLDFGLHICP